MGVHGAVINPTCGEYFTSVCIAHYINEPGPGQDINTCFLEDALGGTVVVRAYVFKPVKKGEELLACYGDQYRLGATANAVCDYEVSSTCPCQLPGDERPNYAQELRDNIVLHGKDEGVSGAQELVPLKPCVICNRSNAGTCQRRYAKP